MDNSFCEKLLLSGVEEVSETGDPPGYYYIFESTIPAEDNKKISVWITDDGHVHEVSIISAQKIE